MDIPLVSILTPSFNQANWIGDTLRSVAVQSYPNIEHIVMDGASRDGTLEALARAEHRVTWRSEPDAGQAHAVNKAYACSSGEIIGWLNSDDAYFQRRAVEVAVRAFESDPDLDVVYSHAALVNRDGLILRMIWVPPAHPRLIRTAGFIVQPSAFIRRRAVGGQLLDETFAFHMDWDLWVRLARAGAKFRRLNTVLAMDRQHPGRKITVMRDTGSREAGRLRSKHGLGVALHAGSRQALVAPLQFARRLAGLTLVGHTREELAFDGHVDSMRALALRQAAAWRRFDRVPGAS